jgi:hypothetical protein
MEGSATGPANFGQLDPAVVNGSGSGPMAAVPAGGGPGGVPPAAGGGGAAPGPAAFSMPGQSQPTPPPQVIQQPPPQAMHNPMPPGFQELNAPVESILLTEIQELKESFSKVRRITVAQGAILFALGVAVIFYLTNTIKARVEVPA